jgi:beta-1,2-mannobiose phosphorylase / 1,2-beta-oligomannan phosphorylase
LTARRASENPILTPRMIRPSRPDFEVVGAFNPGVARHGGDVVLLVRIAEAPLRSAGEVAAPYFDADSGRIAVERWAADRDDVDTSDPRVIVANGRTWLTSLSHLRVARSTDGIRFDVASVPALTPATALESWGIEDPRITLIDDTYWINYTAVSGHGIATGLASTRDFHTFERHGIIFPPQNRDVTIFPERIGGRYAALHRPMPEGIGEPAIWIAWSSDMTAWGEHGVVARARAHCWDNAKVGGGAVPFRVRVDGQDAWLAVYHGVSRSPHGSADALPALEPPLQSAPAYSLGALLLDARDPSRVIARSREPILKPEAVYEREGFFGRVVFTCGLLVQDDRVRIYYGAADEVTAVADLSLDAILRGLI